MKKIKDSKIYKYLAGLSLLSVILIAFATGLGGQFADFCIDEMFNEGNRLRCSDACITSIFASDTLLTDFESAQKINEPLWDNRMEYGCLLNAFMENRGGKDVMISETSIIIDKIGKSKKSIIYLIGIYEESENEFMLYVLNNTLNNLDYCEIEMFGDYFTYSKDIHEEMNLEDFSNLFNDSSFNDSIFHISDLKGGEIRKVYSCKINQEYIKSRERVNLTYFSKNSIPDQINDRTYVGSFGISNSNIYYSYEQGVDSEPFIKKRYVPIDIDNTNAGDKILVVGSIPVSEKQTINIKYYILPSSSCTLTFHAQMKCAGDNKVIETQQFTQKMYTPIYNDSAGTFKAIKNFIKEYRFNVYYYHTDLLAEKEILFTLSDLVV